MSYFKHNAIIITAWCHDTAVETHDKALELFDREMVSEIMISPYSGFESFMIGPDGGKETREASGDFDDKRTDFIQWLHRYNNACSDSDDKIPVCFVEVSYGGDDARTNIEAYNNE